MGDAGQEDAFAIGQDVVERFAVLGRCVGQGGPDVAGLRAGQDGELVDAALVFGDPIHHGMAPALELVRGHVVAVIGCGHGGCIAPATVPGQSGCWATDISLCGASGLATMRRRTVERERARASNLGPWGAGRLENLLMKRKRYAGWMAVLMVGGALLLGVARAAVCPGCGNEIEGASVLLTDQLTLEPRAACAHCSQSVPRCALCSLPAGAGAKTLPDGRVLCARDLAVAVVEPDQVRAIGVEAKRQLDTQLARFLTFPGTNVEWSIEDAVRMEKTLEQLGGQRQCTARQGYVRSREAGGKWTHTIGVLTGLTRPRLISLTAHAYAHAWLKEQVPAGRRLTSAAAEAFCDLVAWRVLDSLGEAAEQQRLRGSNPTDGQLEAILEIHRIYDFYPILQWVQSGADDRLYPAEPDRFRRLDERLAPPAREAVQVIPPAPAVVEAPAALTLTGILGSGAKRLALINGVPLAAGEQGRVRLGTTSVEVRCLEIREGSAVVERVGSPEQLELRLKPTAP